MTTPCKVTLDQFNARCFAAFGELRYGAGLKVGAYEVFFGGWYTGADSPVIVGRWLAWPSQPLMKAPRYFVAQVVPESDEVILQEYKNGESFRLCHKVYAEYLFEPAQQLHLLAWALRAKDALVQYVQVHG